MARMNYSRNNRNRLSDHDMFLDLLTTEKYIAHLYNHAVLECSGDLVRVTFQTLQQTTQSNAQQLSETMHQEGWNELSKQQRPLRNSLSAKSFKKGIASGISQTNVNPGLNGTYRGKSGIYTKPPRYVEQYNTPH
jgi:spore coat protein CotF